MIVSYLENILPEIENFLLLTIIFNKVYDSLIHFIIAFQHSLAVEIVSIFSEYIL